MLKMRLFMAVSMLFPYRKSSFFTLSNRKFIIFRHHISMPVKGAASTSGQHGDESVVTSWTLGP